jgi:hypothetical protein
MADVARGIGDFPEKHKPDGDISPQGWGGSVGVSVWSSQIDPMFVPKLELTWGC